MKASDSIPAATIDAYIAAFPADIQSLLKQLRATVKKIAPEAQEKISYAMPAFTLNGNLVYFAAMKRHLGFYPGAKAIEVFKARLTSYKTSKGAIQFPYSLPIPWALVEDIVRFKREENSKRKG